MAELDRRQRKRWLLSYRLAVSAIVYTAWLPRTMLAEYGRPICNLDGFTIHELSPTP